MRDAAPATSAMPELALRPVEPGDEPFLERLYASTREDELRPLPWSDEQKRAFLAQQFAAQSAHYRKHYAASATFDVVLVDGRPLGRLYVARLAEELRIVDVAMLPEARGRGIGTRLIEAVLEEGDAAGKPVSIHVERTNPALSLYRRLGFVPVDEGEAGVYLLLRREAPIT